MFGVLKERFRDISDFIEAIPENENGVEIISEYQKEFYIKSMNLRIEKLLQPRYHQIEGG